jgi:hypothetical protein
MTGIGTPSSQSRIPRPITCLSFFYGDNDPSESEFPSL